MTNKALGRGLSALIPEKDTSQATRDSILQIPILQVKTNKYQPRTEFNQDKLNDLISSIKEKGVVQPILVRKTQDGYELIAGERRLRAVKNLGIDKIPAIVKDVADVDMLEISLIENIQREDLNPIEEANAFQKFITDFNYTQDRVARAVGKNSSTISNTMRLLTLPKKIQDFISKNSISAGHAKAILALPTETAQLRAADIIIRKGLSVREAEQLTAKKSQAVKSITVGKDRNIAAIENELQQILGTRVHVFHGKKRGRIQIEYYSNEDLDRLVAIISKKA